MTIPFEFKIQHFKKLSSTNTHARAEAEMGAEEGMVYVADFQTAGRGQFDRTWESSAGKNLLFSVLIRPKVTPAHAPIITQLACHAVVKMLKDSYKIEAETKRPNDVMIGGKKICGILSESSSDSPHHVEHVIIGIGLNVNEAPKGVTPKPISMKEILGHEVSPSDVLEKLLVQLKKDLSELYGHSS